MSAKLLKVTWSTVGYGTELEKDFFDIATEIDRSDTPEGTEVTYSVTGTFDADDTRMVNGLLEDAEGVITYEWINDDATV